MSLRNKKKTNYHIKDTHREKVPSNKTPALRESTNMGVWAVGTLIQLVLKLKQNFKKKK